MIAAMAVFLLAVTAVSIMMPSASADDDDTFRTYTDIRAESYLVGVGKTVEYKIFAIGDNDKDVKFAASLKDSNGNTVSRVTPTTGNSVSADGTTLTVTAPGDAGMYTLTVVFTYLDDNDDEIVVTKTAPVRVVTPIKLSATLKNNSGTLTELSVWFIVDGVKVEGSEKEISIKAGGTETVTYDWVTEGLGHGAHTMTIGAEIGILEEGLIDTSTSTFYVGQNSYTLTEVLLVVVLIVLLIVLIIVIRKPVKNVGKPKARR